jgi:hypothetical protein
LDRELSWLQTNPGDERNRMDKASFIGWCVLGLGAALAVFFPLGPKRRAGIPSFAWWLCLIAGAVACIYGLSHSTAPSFAPRITAIGRASDCVAKGGRQVIDAFNFFPEGGGSVRLETQIIMPHWGNPEKFNGRTLRIVYLSDTARNPSNEAINIEILNGDSAAWHDSLDARPFGIWLGIPFGAALGGFGYFGIRYRKNDSGTAEEPAAEPSEVTSLNL